MAFAIDLLRRLRSDVDRAASDADRLGKATDEKAFLGGKTLGLRSFFAGPRISVYGRRQRALLALHFPETARVVAGGVLQIFEPFDLGVVFLQSSA